MARVPIEIVEVDQDFCQHTFGVAPCRASLGVGPNQISWSENLKVGATTNDAVLDTREDFDGVMLNKTQPTEAFVGYPMTRQAPGSVEFSMHIQKGGGGELARIQLVGSAGSSTITYSLPSVSMVTGSGNQPAANITHGYVDLGSSYRLWIRFSLTQNPLRHLSIRSYAGLSLGGMQLSDYSSGSPEPLEYIKTEAQSTDGASAKCFNTITTCASLPDYSRTTKTLRFCTNSQDHPEDGNIYHATLQSVRTKPAEINPGGGDEGMSALGKRATLSVNLSDHQSADRDVDPYWKERLSGAAQADRVAYDPYERGTFWRKWRARNQYYLNRPIRYISAYIENGQIIDPVTRHFVVTGFSGPNETGRVQIEAKDVLHLAQIDKAQAPRPSSGKLAADITASATSATLYPPGIGDAEYPATGKVRIGSEIIEFTRTGDAMTLVRAQNNTVASDYSEGDTVQICWVVPPSRPDKILLDLLTNYTNIDPVYFDPTQWETEALEFLPALYDGIVSEPTGVDELVGELCEQMYFYAWYDEEDAKIRIRAVRPASGEVVNTYDEDSHILKNSVSVSEDDDQVLTRLVINYGLRNPAEGIGEASNYLVTDVFGNFDEEGDDRYRGSRSKIIYSRWISNRNGAAAEQLGKHLLARYRVPPRRIQFSLDAKDRALGLADFANVSVQQITDQYGGPVINQCQVIRAEEARAGSEYKYTAQRFVFELPPPVGEYLLVLSADDMNLNLWEWFQQQYDVVPDPGDTVRVQIRQNVVVGSTSTTEHAMRTGVWPSGVNIIMEVGAGAFIAGRGGNAGMGGGTSSSENTRYAQRTGQPGGPALLAESPITILNYGTIGGGGGGGGGGVGTSFSPYQYPYDFNGSGGGGGAGRVGGSGGARDENYGYSGNPGQLSVGGNGGARRTSGVRVATAGGKGGDLGQPGAKGQNHPSGNSNITAQGGPGGAPGNAITGQSLITFEAQGTILGPRT